MKTAKPSAPVVGRRLRRTLGALLAIGFASTWWKFVPTKESAAAPLDPPADIKPTTESPKVVVIAIPVLLPFALPPPPTPVTPKPQARHRPRIVRVPQVAVIPTDVIPPHEPFALPPPEIPPDPPVIEETPEVPPPTTDEPRIRTRSS